MNHLRRLATFSACALAFAACSDDDPSDPVTDAGDTSAEVGADTAVDADVGPDAVEDSFAISGLSAPVDVWLDELGIPHISCQTDADCVAALGYMHARDRFAQMDIRRRVTTGRLHQLVGELAVDIDVTNRNLYSTPDGRPAEEALLEGASADTMALLEAYSRGVNAWLDDQANQRNGASLQDEYGFALVNVDTIPPWEPSDCLATVLALINSLTNDSDRELALGAAYGAAPDDMANDLYGVTPAIESVIHPGYEFPKSGPLLPSPAVAPEAIARLRDARPALEAARDRVIAANILRPFDIDGDRGSNNWVLAPEMTADGVGLLSNDPHLGLSNPAVWYYAHIDSKTNGTGSYHAAGQSFAGMPWIVIGQNEDIAWGATNSTLDQSDVYIESVTDDGNAVMIGGERVPIVEVDYALDPFDADALTRSLFFVPGHGPLLELDRENRTGVSLAWTGNRVTTDGNFLTEMMRASTVDEARTACRQITTIGQNWVVVDTAGSIGWFPYNHVPTRPWASMELPSFLPLPGDGQAEWGDWVPYEDLPQLYNPESGYIATANNDMTGSLSDGDPFNDGSTPMQVYAAAGYRHARIVELIEADAGDHSPETMQAIVGDTFSAFGRDIVPALLDIVAEVEFDGAGADLVDALTAWDFECPTGLAGPRPDSQYSDDEVEAASSIGCSAFHVLVGRLMAAVFTDEIQDSGATLGADVEALVRLILRPDSLHLRGAWWDDITTDDVEETDVDIVTAAIDESGAWLADRLGDSPSDWRWGRIHTTTLRADLFDSFGVGTYNNGEWANDGGMYTVDVASPRSVINNDYTHGSGASTRWVCRAPESGVRCSVQLPGGQRHFRDSPNYEDALQRWLRNEPTELEFDMAAAEANAVSSIRFEVGE